MRNAIALLDVIVWPLVTVIIFFLARKQIMHVVERVAELIGRSTNLKVKAGQLDVEISSGAAAVRRALEASEGNVQEVTPLALPASVVIESGTDNGLLVVEEAFERVRASLRQGHTGLPAISLSDLAERRSLPDSLVLAVRAFEELRAQVLANPDVHLQPGSLSEFVSLGDAILARVPPPTG